MIISLYFYYTMLIHKPKYTYKVKYVHSKEESYNYE